MWVCVCVCMHASCIRVCLYDKFMSKGTSCNATTVSVSRISTKGVHSMCNYKVPTLIKLYTQSVQVLTSTAMSTVYTIGYN